MVRNILRRFLPKFVWRLEKRAKDISTLPNITFKVPLNSDDTVIILWYIDEGKPPVVDSVLVNGQVLEKDEYNVR